MQDAPGPSELLSRVAHFLRQEVLPALDAHRAFQLRVATNALDLIARQLALEPEANEEELTRLRRLAGRAGSLEELNADLAAAIAEGRTTNETPGLIEHLWATTLAKLRIDQPQYESYQREVTRESSKQSGGHDEL